MLLISTRIYIRPNLQALSFSPSFLDTTAVHQKIYSGERARIKGLFLTLHSATTMQQSTRPQAMQRPLRPQTNVPRPNALLPLLCITLLISEPNAPLESLRRVCRLIG